MQGLAQVKCAAAPPERQLRHRKQRFGSLSKFALSRADLSLFLLSLLHNKSLNYYYYALFAVSRADLSLFLSLVLHIIIIITIILVIVIINTSIIIIFVTVKFLLS